MINQANPDVLWVALGLPKQERWIVAHLDRLKAPVIVAVGAAISFTAARLFPRRAGRADPAWNGFGVCCTSPARFGAGP